MDKEQEDRIKKQLIIIKKSVAFCKHNPMKACDVCLKNLRGDVTGIWGDVSGIKGDVTGIWGYV